MYVCSSQYLKMIFQCYGIIYRFPDNFPLSENDDMKYSMHVCMHVCNIKATCITQDYVIIKPLSFAHKLRMVIIQYCLLLTTFSFSLVLDFDDIIHHWLSIHMCISSTLLNTICDVVR